MVMLVEDRLRARLTADHTEVRMLLIHPMDSGRGLDIEGRPIPAAFIQDIRCWRNDEEVLSIKCGGATAENPYFAFQLVGGEAGDIIKVRWVDNLGKKGVVDTRVL